MLGQWISNQIGGVCKSPSHIVSATIDGYADTRFYWLGLTTSAVNESSISGEQFSSIALLLDPDSPLETVFMGLVRAPLLFPVPFGSSSAFQKLALVESSVQSMYRAALLSAVFLIALVP